LPYLSGSHRAVRGYLWSSSLIQANLFLSKKTFGASDSKFLIVCFESEAGYSLFLMNWKIAIVGSTMALTGKERSQDK